MCAAINTQLKEKLELIGDIYERNKEKNLNTEKKCSTVVRREDFHSKAPTPNRHKAVWSDMYP